MNVRTIKGIYNSNTFIVESADTVIIVDAGAPLAVLCDVLGDRKPDAVLLTHEHFDHIFHIADYCRVFACPIYCHVATLTELKDKNAGAPFSVHGFEIKIPDSLDNFIALSKNCTFAVGQGEELINVQTIASPGHSLGSVVYLLKSYNSKASDEISDTDRLLFTGDVLFAKTIGRTDLIPYGPELMQKTLAALKKVKFDTAYHGHGKSSTYSAQQDNIDSFIN